MSHRFVALSLSLFALALTPAAAQAAPTPPTLTVESSTSTFWKTFGEEVTVAVHDADGDYVPAAPTCTVTSSPIGTFGIGGCTIPVADTRPGKNPAKDFTFKVPVYTSALGSFVITLQTGGASVTWGYQTDRDWTGPQVSWGPYPTTTSETTVWFSWTLTDRQPQVSVTCTLDNFFAVPCTVTGAQLSGLNPGYHTLTLKTLDGLGNSSFGAAGFYVMDPRDAYDETDDPNFDDECEDEDCSEDEEEAYDEDDYLTSRSKTFRASGTARVDGKGRVTVAFVCGAKAGCTAGTFKVLGPKRKGRYAFTHTVKVPAGKTRIMTVQLPKKAVKTLKGQRSVTVKG